MKLTSHKLLTSILAAAALLLGACVAETGDTGDDDDPAPVATSTAADTFVPMLPKDPGGAQAGGSSSTPSHTVAKLPGDDTGTACSDPEPSPWQPPSSNH